MAVNTPFFEGPNAASSYLAARGFDAGSGSRSGGIIAPQRVLLPAGAKLLRLFHDPRRQFGAWWSTPHELALVVAHFARGGAAFDEGRSAGNGLLHATLAVRHDWSGHDPEHLGRFMVAKTRHDLEAFHGEGDDAPDGTQSRNLKPQPIVVQGRQRRVRQLFLPSCASYAGEFEVLQAGWTSADLLAALRGHAAAPLPFEL